MASSFRTRRAVARALRGLIFDVCVLAGGLCGLVVGLNAPPRAAPECRSASCFSEGLVAAAVPILIPAGVGLLVGAALGAFLARLVPVFRGPKRRWIVARYADSCAACGTAVQPGDRVRHDAAARLVYCGCRG